MNGFGTPILMTHMPGFRHIDCLEGGIFFIFDNGKEQGNKKK
jgi:hypothetical protein